MVRANPGNHFDGVGWSRLTFDGTRMENEYVMWRKTKTVLAETAVDSGTGDNVNQILSPASRSPLALSEASHGGDAAHLQSASCRRRGWIMNHKRIASARLGAGASVELLRRAPGRQRSVAAHELPPKELEAYEAEFKEQVRLGDLLFHGDAATGSNWA